MSKNKPHIHIYYDELPKLRGIDRFDPAKEMRSLTKGMDATIHIHIDGKKSYAHNDRIALQFMLGQYKHQYLHELYEAPAGTTLSRLRQRLSALLERIRATVHYFPRKEGSSAGESPSGS